MLHQISIPFWSVFFLVWWLSLKFLFFRLILEDWNFFCCYDLSTDWWSLRLKRFVVFSLWKKISIQFFALIVLQRNRFSKIFLNFRKERFLEICIVGCKKLWFLIVSFFPLRQLIGSRRCRYGIRSKGGLGCRLSLKFDVRFFHKIGIFTLASRGSFCHYRIEY